MVHSVTVPERRSARARPRETPPLPVPQPPVPGLPKGDAAGIATAIRQSESEHRQATIKKNEALIDAIFAAEAKAAAEVVEPRKKEPVDPLAMVAVGTRAVYAFRQWLVLHALELPIRLMSFYKDTRRVAVYEYLLPNHDPICAVLAWNDSLQKTHLDNYGMTVVKGESRLREFREWRASIDEATKELVAKGWKLRNTGEAWSADLAQQRDQEKQNVLLRSKGEADGQLF